MQHWSTPVTLNTARRGVAVMIDGENIPQTAADQVLHRAEAMGPLISLRVYTDRAHPNGWDTDARFKMVYLDGIAGKNSVDIQLVIEAMDISHAGVADAFVLVSTDRDFAPLARRLRDGGLHVLGMGRGEASPRFRHACSQFIELSKGAEQPGALPKGAAKPAKAAPGSGAEIGANLIRLSWSQSEDSAMKKGLLITQLNTIVRAKTGRNINETPEKSWRKYLTAEKHKHMYICDPQGPQARVRLA